MALCSIVLLEMLQRHAGCWGSNHPGLAAGKASVLSASNWTPLVPYGQAPASPVQSRFCLCLLLARKGGCSGVCVPSPFPSCPVGLDLAVSLRGPAAPTAHTPPALQSLIFSLQFSLLQGAAGSSGWLYSATRSGASSCCLGMTLLNSRGSGRPVARSGRAPETVWVPGTQPRCLCGEQVPRSCAVSPAPRASLCLGSPDPRERGR